MLAIAALLAATLLPISLVVCAVILKARPTGKQPDSAAQPSAIPTSPPGTAEGNLIEAACQPLHKRIDELRGQVAHLEERAANAEGEAHRWKHGGDLRRDIINNELRGCADAGKPENVIKRRILERELAILELRAASEGQ